jgi:hypothetical protein
MINFDKNNRYFLKRILSLAISPKKIWQLTRALTVKIFLTQYAPVMTQIFPKEAE